jgi:arginyl-tRNA synthetase
MHSVIDILEERISAAMAAVSGQSGFPAIVRPAAGVQFGDYQVNGVMPLAKKIKANPKQLAEKVLGKIDVADICEKPEIAGPGFINLRLKPDFVAQSLLQINKDKSGRLGIEKTQISQTVVVDFSCPNIAKEMHVGHLRSTIIGDCICRLLEFEGHKVIRQNHIGDWGTQFGMLMALLDEKSRETEKHTGVALQPEELKSPLVIFEDFYKEANQRDSTDEKFTREARAAVVALHNGDTKYEKLWLIIVRESMKHYKIIYDILGVNLTDNDIRGESFYRAMLVNVVEELKKKKDKEGNPLAVESEGAVCVFPEGFKTKEDKPLPFIIQKSDGAYLYATTDLAALRYRVTGIEYGGKKYKADKIIYVTDARQKQHFEMLFAVAKMAGWLKDGQAIHVSFGSVLGENGRPLKTREGENVKLKDLLDEACLRAKAIVEQKNPDLPDEKKKEIANAVGIGAVKYADFSNNRTSDYVFSFDKMLAMEGNTAPYMQYAYARIKSIERKAPEKGVNFKEELAKVTKVKDLNLTEPAELDLAKYLVRYGEAVESALADYRPNFLTGYLYELAQKFSVFYTNCPVLDAGPDKRPTRLLLCDLTAMTIRHGLSELLGIEVPQQM